MDYPGWTEAIGTWVGGIGTIIALVVSFAARREVRQTRKAEALSRTRAQAESVVGWVEYLDQGKTVSTHPELVVRIRNASDLPVYNVLISLECGVQGKFVEWLNTVGPATTWEVRVPIPAPPHGEVFAPDMYFRDAGGHQWIRSSSGELNESSIDSFDLIQHTGSYYDEHPTMDLLRPKCRVNDGVPDTPASPAAV